MIFKRLLVATVALLLSFFAASVASGQDGPTRFIESYNEYIDGHTSPSITIYLEGPIKGKVGWVVWGWGTNQWAEDGGQWSTEKWAEGLVGLTFAPVDFVQVAIMVGVETNEKPLRYAGNLWISKGRITLESSYENGGSGYWYRYTGTIRVGSWRIGANSTKFLGIGPYLEKSFGLFDLWVAPVKSGNSVIGSAGLRFNF